MHKSESTRLDPDPGETPPIWQIVRYLNGAYRDRSAIQFADAVRVLAEHYGTTEQVLATGWQHASLGDG